MDEGRRAAMAGERGNTSGTQGGRGRGIGRSRVDRGEPRERARDQGAPRARKSAGPASRRREGEARRSGWLSKTRKSSRSGGTDGRRWRAKRGQERVFLSMIVFLFYTTTHPARPPKPLRQLARLRRRERPPARLAMPSRIARPLASFAARAAATVGAAPSSTPLAFVRAFSLSVPLSARAPKAPKGAATAGSSSASGSSSSSQPPLPNVLDLVVGESQPNRLEDYYHDALADDLMYLTYSHKLAIAPELPHPNPSWYEMQPGNRYALNRPQPQPKGKRKTLIPIHHNVTPYTIPRLEKVVVSVFDKQAIQSKSSLLGCFHALKTITGQTEFAGGDRNRLGVQLIRAKKGAATWNLRKGMPCGAKVVLQGPDMYRFIEVLTEFVFPRLRDWKGLPLHHGRHEDRAEPGSTGGTVSLGFEAPVMALFPQIEACLDIYPKMYGATINFCTNQRGEGAQDRARKLLSGMRVPFYRPGFKPVKKAVFVKGGKSKTAKR